MKTGIKIEKKKANKVLKYLKENDLIDTKYFNEKDPDYLYVPLVKKINLENFKIIERNFKKKQEKKEFKTEVIKILKDDEISLLKTAYDIVGDIAILEIDEPLLYKSKKIGEILLECNKNIKTVLRKKGAHEGELRIQKYDFIVGENKKESMHKENGCVLKIPLDDVYYSARSATERKRIAEQIKKNEKVLVMFSGAGPYVCVIAKKTSAEYVLGIELNEKGYEVALENIKLNKIKHADLINGDVRDFCKDLKEKNILFDRIIMPLPKTADEFLPYAFMVAKKNAVIHLYDFVDEKYFPNETIQKINKHSKKIEILNSVKCGQFSPSIYRVCIDFKII